MTTDVTRPPSGPPAGVELLPVIELRSRGELEAARRAAADAVAFEDLLQRGYAHAESWLLPAICQACDRGVALVADKQHGSDGKVNFRERLICPHCQLNTRQRFMAHLVRSTLGGRPGTRVYLHEQITPFFSWAVANLPGEVMGSEYLGHDLVGGTAIDGIRHEDALALSFGDDSLDVIISQDVLEHVPSIDDAISEAARVLRPGGRFLFSVPFNAQADSTVQRATVIDGEVVHLMEPHFHGNPVSSEGSLVFYDHGWDLLERLRDAGFADTCLLGTWSALYGYLSNGLVILFSATRA